MASEAKIQWTINYQWLVMLGGILEKGGEFCCDCVEEIFLFSKVRDFFLFVLVDHFLGFRACLIHPYDDDDDDDDGDDDGGVDGDGDSGDDDDDDDV